MSKDGQMTDVLMTMIAKEVTANLSSGLWTPAQAIAALGTVAAAIKRVWNVDYAEVTAELIKMKKFQATLTEGDKGIAD